MSLGESLERDEPSRWPRCTTRSSQRSLSSKKRDHGATHPLG
jgi:hypothetical protein